MSVDQQGATGLVQNYALYAYNQDGSAAWRQAGSQQQWLDHTADGALEQVTITGGDTAVYYDDAQGLRAEKLVAGGPWWSV